MNFVEFTTITGRKIMVSAIQICAFAECRDVKDCGCRILVSGYPDWLYIRDSYDDVKNAVS